MIRTTYKPVPAHLLFLAAAGIMLTSCSGRPERIRQPALDVDVAVDGALSQYDTDLDGTIAGDELAAAPTVPFWDTNGDGEIPGDEIRQQLELWKKSRLGLMELYATVTLDGQPLSEATVTLEPEAYLGDNISRGQGITDSDGTATISVPERERPHPRVTGVRLGIYHVRISKLVNGEETIPIEYNRETTLACRVEPGMVPMVKFDL